ncbi:MAG: ATP-binding cassette domain-containing protein [Candidatus Caldarchaeum sp.]
MMKAYRLSIGYGGKPLATNINVELKPGEFTVVIGPNASGKTTLLKTLSGLLKPLAGTVFIGGDELTRLGNRSRARRVGVVLTGRQEVEGMLVEEVVSLGRYPWTGPLHFMGRRDREVVEKSMAMTGVLHLRSRRISELSDGQFQRVMIARALAQEPEILILDEPTTHLDAKSRIEVIKLLRFLAHHENMTIVASTHELELAFRFADKIILTAEHGLIVSENPEELIASPSFTKAFGFDGELTISPQTLTVEFRHNPENKGPTAFVIAGGGTGSQTIRQLLRNNYRVVAGVLHENDVDYVVATALGVEVVAEKPFQKIGEKTLQQALEKMMGCDVVVYTDPPIGDINRQNLTLLRTAIQNNKPTFRTASFPSTADLVQRIQAHPRIMPLELPP